MMIPRELRERNQWLLWSAESDPPKAPLNKDGRRASWTDPASWLSYEEAGDLAENRVEFDGVGFVVIESDPYLGLDLDGCLREPREEKPKDWLPSLEPLTETFMQYSTSGTGIHVFTKGDRLPDWWTDSHFSDKDHEGVEAYDEKFFVMTGDQVDVAADTITGVDVTPFLAAAYESINGEPPRLPGSEDSPDSDVSLGIYDVLSRSEYPEGENVSHPFHSSSTGTNFRVDAGSETFRCWRHGVTGNGLHLLGMEQGVIECGEWLNGGLNRDTWREIFDAGREAGHDIPEPKTSNGGTVATDHTAVPDTSRGGQDLTPAGVAAAAGVDMDDLTKLSAAKKAYFAWELIEASGEYHIVARLPDETLFAYDPDTGIWRDNGEQVVRAAGREILKDEYGTSTGNELVEQVITAPGAQRRPDQFGVPEGYVAVANGLLDMDAREVRSLRPDDYAIRRLPVAFDPDATAERWSEFVREVVEPGEKWSQTVQEYVGYTLMFDQLPHHRALLLVGEGANGKSTFLNVVRQLLGRGNLCATSLQKLANDEHARADLFGTIANIDADLSTAALGDGGMFKKLLGDDRVQARKLYQAGFEFDARQKHLYAANEVPDTNIDDDAFFRRWLLVEFPNYFPPSERDPDLLDDLTTDESLSGILNWALDGRDRLLDQGGFSHEPLAGEVRERWRSWGDAVTEFVDEFIEPDPDGRFSSGEAYSRFKGWYRRNKNGSPPSHQRLTAEIKTAEGATYKRNMRIGTRQRRGFVGVSFTNDAPRPGEGSDVRVQETL